MHHIHWASDGWDFLIVFIFAMLAVVAISLAIDAVLKRKPHRYLVSFCISIAIASIATGLIRSIWLTIWHFQHPGATASEIIIFKPLLAPSVVALVFSIIAAVLSITSRKESAKP